MFTYILIFIIISITLFCIYITNKIFEPKIRISETKRDSVEDLNINVTSDCIVILSVEGCPYCDKLMNAIEGAKNKYTVITLKPDATFKFDSVFIELSLEDRNNIISEVEKIFAAGGKILFPSIIIKDKLHSGLPKEDVIKQMFIV